MVYKCNNCGGDLVYSVEHNMMMCAFCGTLVDINSLPTGQNQSNNQFGQTAQRAQATDNRFGQAAPELKITNEPFFQTPDVNQIGDYNTLVARKEQEKMVSESRADSMIQMQVCKCTSCGAELMVNGVEASTFCAYCGQATVVMDRVEDCLKPDYIIPFKINKDDAERIIRNTLQKGFFVPPEIKNFEVEKLRGIYIPFWLMDFYYEDSQCYKYSKKSGKSTVTRYAYIKGECNFKNVTVDASKNLDNDSSQRLEPYDMRQLKYFNPTYLSGFYSDRFDDEASNLEALAVARMKYLFDNQMAADSGHPTAKLVYSNPRHAMRGTKYALLPAWFLSFKYDGKPFTVMVNGQTGKMVGAVPYVKSKMALLFTGLSILFSAIAIPVLAAVFYLLYDPDDISKLFIMFVVGMPVLAVSVWVFAKKKLDSIKSSIKLTKSKANNKYMKERQDA